MLAIDDKEKAIKKEEEVKLLLNHEVDIAQGVLESKAKYRKVVQAGIAKWVNDFQRGLIEVKSVDDLKKLIELDIALQKDEI